MKSYPQDLLCFTLLRYYVIMLLCYYVIMLLQKVPFVYKVCRGVFIGKWVFFIGKWVFFIGKWLFFNGKWLFFNGKWLFFNGKWLFFNGKWLFRVILLPTSLILASN